MKVTTELKKSIKTVKPTVKFKSVFSDTRLNKTAIGVKICDLFFTQEEVSLICNDMTKKGFKLCSVKINKFKNFDGTRFTFLKINQ